MRVTLVNPNYDEPRVLKFMGLPSIPIGLAYVAATLEQAGHEVKVVDAFGFKYNVEKTVEEAIKTDPEFIGISCVTCNIDYGKQIAEKLRARFPVAIGGTMPSLEPDTVVDYADYIMYGEGEKTFVELLSGKDPEEIDGLMFKKDGKVIKTNPRIPEENLDSIPFPARHLFPMHKYKLFGPMSMATMMTSRGCPMTCNYCSISHLFPSWRGRSAKNVVDEMEFLIEQYKVKGISFVDEDFLVDLPRALEICDEIENRNLKVWWGMQTRADRVPDLETMKRFNRAGCECLLFGIESVQEKTMKNLNRDISNDLFFRAVKLGRASRMRVAVSSILGFPGETIADAKATVNFVLKLDPDYVFFGVPTPFPGTRFYESCKQEGLIKEKNLLRYTIMSPILETEEIKLADGKKLLNYAYRKFYFRPIKMLQRVVSEVKKLDKETFKGFFKWSFDGFFDSQKW